MMRSLNAFFSACVALLALAGGPAYAEIGPCRPDTYRGLICGEGDGAARVIDHTMSPSRRLALAWRSRNSPPTEAQTDRDADLELLVIRLKDGAVLSRRETEYWDTGDSHVNRLRETATWSPDSRFMINTFEQRFNTATIDLYAFDRNDKARGAFDLIKLMEGAARSELRRHVKDDGTYEFSLDWNRLKIDNRGLVRAAIMLWVPKDGPERHYAMTLQATLKGDGLDAKVLSVTPTRAPR
jgi:hypothetical protein